MTYCFQLSLGCTLTQSLATSSCVDADRHGRHRVTTAGFVHPSTLNVFSRVAPTGTLTRRWHICVVEVDFHQLVVLDLGETLRGIEDVRVRFLQLNVGGIVRRRGRVGRANVDLRLSSHVALGTR